MSYFTAIFPFFGLAALLTIACLEDGAFQGIKFFFQPDLEKLKDINVILLLYISFCYINSFLCINISLKSRNIDGV